MTTFIVADWPAGYLRPVLYWSDGRQFSRRDLEWLDRQWGAGGSLRVEVYGLGERQVKVKWSSLDHVAFLDVADRRGWPKGAPRVYEGRLSRTIKQIEREKLLKLAQRKMTYDLRSAP